MAIDTATFNFTVTLQFTVDVLLTLSRYWYTGLVKFAGLAEYHFNKVNEF